MNLWASKFRNVVYALGNWKMLIKEAVVYLGKAVE